MTDKSKLMRYAIDYLSKYNSSKSNLVKILKNKIRRLKAEKGDKFILYNSIEKIIDELEKNNLINDYNYTQSKIRGLIFKGKSKMFIKSYFYQKGISEEIISKNFEDCDSKNSNWEIESAKIFARKKGFLNKPEDREKKLAKMARAGFSYDLSKKILNES